MNKSLHIHPAAPLGGIVFDIKKYAIHDGPGIRTTVYLKGCPLSCTWCHNPEGQSPEPEIVFWPHRCLQCKKCLDVCPGEHADLNSAECTHCGKCAQVCPAKARKVVGRWMSVDDVMVEIIKDVIFYDQSGGGVTFSGGEPLARPSFLKALLQACKELEIHTAVDTTGLIASKTLRTMLPYVDLFLYDLKLMDDTAHRRHTGVSNQSILENLALLAQEGQKVVVRVPIIPGITNGQNNIQQIGRLASSLDIQQIDILAYHPMAAEKYGRLGRGYTLQHVAPPSKAEMEEIAGRLKNHGLTVTMGG